MAAGSKALGEALAGFARRQWWLVLGTCVLAFITTRAVLEATGGEPAVPLDDAYIHFQFARSFAELTPFVYTSATAPTPGATSLAWPGVLAIFYALGFHGTSIIWPAWALGWLCLGLLAHETRRLASGLVEPDVAVAAAVMTLAFGGHTWFAGSGMEVLPFAWVLTRTARRVAEWGERSHTGEAGHEQEASRRALELCVLGVAGPLLRPEGIVGTALVIGALLLRAKGKRRALALVPVAGVFLPAAIYWLATGSASSTTQAVKWLPASPYFDSPRLWSAIAYHLRLFFGTLLDGRLWSALFIPAGSAVLAWAALASLPVAGWVRRRPWRAAVVSIVCLGMLIPTTYETFLVNRLRYLWPFAAAWLVGAATLAQLAGDLGSRFGKHLARLPLVIAGVFVGGLGSQLSMSIDDLATSAEAVRQQQVSLGRWARDHLPRDATIGVNDAGAIAYFSERRVFDVVGLTTSSEGRFWVAGPGSRFEHYESLGEAKLPTHFIVYPEWMSVAPVLGERLTDRTVTNATILGGTSMVAFVASYSVLGSAHSPADPAGELVDRLDVADLESEAGHEYELDSAAREWNVVVQNGARADGARTSRGRDRFELALSGGGALIARFAADEPLELEVNVDGERIGSLRLDGRSWEEHRVDVPPGVDGRHVVEIRALGWTTFTSMHYWSYRKID